MIKSLIFMFIVFNAYAVEDLQQRWLTVFKISEIHPEYNLRDEIKHPEGTWQLMAKVHSLEAFGKTNRADCLFVKVPQSGDGEIKVIAINENQSCAEARENDSLYRWKKLKKIAIQIQEDSTTFTLTDDAGRVVRENFKFLNTPKKSRFEIHSQPESKDVIYFQPNSLKQNNSVVK